MNKLRFVAAFLCILLCKINYSIAQNNFIKTIDIDSLPQHGLQLNVLNDNIYVNFYSSCDSLRTICSGILKLDLSGEVLDWSLLQNFSTNKNAMLYDENKNGFIYTGEVYRGVRNAFKITVFDPVFLDSLESFEVYDSLNRFQEMIQNTNALVDGKLIISGNTLYNGEQLGLVYYLDDDFSLDTLIILKTGSSTNIISTQFRDGENDVFYFDNANSGPNGEDLTSIIKINRASKKIVWNWTSEPIIQIYGQLPYGFLSQENELIISKIGGPSPRWSEIWTVTNEMEVKRKFKFPFPYDEHFNPTDKQIRSIYRLREAKNGDILGCGEFTDNNLTSPNINNIPYIFRISKEGVLLWERAYHNTSLKIPKASGYMSDLIEMEDGSLLAVGTLYNYLQYDPVVQQGRQDPDIILASLDADGCLNGDCSKLMNVSNLTSESQNELIYKCSIYPNPNAGKFEVQADFEVGLIDVFNLAGDLLVSLENPSKSFDLSFLSNGVYSCRLVEKRGSRYRFAKIIIVK